MCFTICVFDMRIIFLMKHYMLLMSDLTKNSLDRKPTDDG